MRRGFSLSGRVWVVGGLMGVRGECEGRWLLKLLSVGFGDGVRCSRSLLRGLPPPTHLYLSLGTDRIEHGSILMVKDRDGGAGPVQSAGVMATGKVLAPSVVVVLLGWSPGIVLAGVVVSPLVRGVLLGEDVEDEGGVIWSMIISVGLK